MLDAASPRATARPPRLVVLQPRDFAPRFGAPQQVHLVKAAEILDQLPQPLQHALHDALGASAAVYALLLAEDDAVREKQLHAVRQRIRGGMADEVLKLAPWVAAVPVEHKLPLLELSVTGLRELSPAQYLDFREATLLLAEMDGEIDLFEFVLMKVVLHGLGPFFEPPRRKATEFYSIKPLLPDCAVLVSALTHLGQDDRQQAEAAFARGIAEVSRVAGASATFLTMDQCGLDAVDRALERLGRAVPQIRKNALTACAIAVAADGKVRSGEAELLRAIALTLDCPLPPFVS
jgi:tellurite resistance protein